MTFYLKYRPQTIEELDIVSVRDSLKSIVKSGEIPHALLFSGPKGTGKTSTARILSKIINCESRLTTKPCNKCENCLSITNGSNIDVIEMDAASNRGIDDIRALRDVVKLSPSKSKAKIYIIDEAHMLTTEASNALLKTLEEPPSHVYFVLATTNPEKLIETIRSRTVTINFTKATSEETKRSLMRIIKSEKIKINEGELTKIARLSKGSFRDAVKLLEQHTKDDNFLNNQKTFDTDNFIELLKTKNALGLIDEVEKASKNGLSIETITESILGELQKELIKVVINKEQLGITKDELIYLIELMLEAQEFNNVTPIEDLPLQIAIIKWCNFK